MKHEIDNETASPPWTDNYEGKTRQLGVEIEFSGVSVEDTATLIVQQFGGKRERVSAYEIVVRDTELGDFRVEVDLALLKKLGQKAEKDPDDGWTEAAARVLSSVAEVAVPMEIAAPPIPWNELARLDRMIEQLRVRGALGTRESAIYAFGVHLNPETPARDAETLTAFLRAFVSLFDWLVHAHEVDISRRISSFIRRYPAGYEELMLSSDYAPELPQLIDDYLRYNASRNRALDMLPLFTWLDEDRVRQELPDEKINPRPTFHYRLPNSEVDLERWSLRRPWERWLVVERLAQRPELLDEIAQARKALLEDALPFKDSRWVEQLEARWPALL